MKSLLPFILVCACLASCAHNPEDTKREIASRELEIGNYRDFSHTKWVFKMGELGLYPEDGSYVPLNFRPMTADEISQLTDGAQLQYSNPGAFFGKVKKYKIEFIVNGNEATLKNFNEGPFWVSPEGGQYAGVRFSDVFYTKFCDAGPVKPNNAEIHVTCFERGNDDPTSIIKNLTDADFSLIKAVDPSRGEIKDLIYKKSKEVGFYNFDSALKVIRNLAQTCSRDRNNKMCYWDGQKIDDLKVVDLTEKHLKLSTTYAGVTTIFYNREKNYIFASIGDRATSPRDTFEFYAKIVDGNKIEITTGSDYGIYTYERKYFDLEE